MTLSHSSKIIGVDGITLFPVTADSSSSYTCGTGVAVPGVKQFKVTDKMLEAIFKNGKYVEHQKTELETIDFSFGFSKLDLDVKELVEGGTVVDSGTTPNEIVTYSRGGGDEGSYFQLQAQLLEQDNSGGDIVWCLFKCKGKIEENDYSWDKYSEFICSGVAIPTIKTFTRDSVTKKIIEDVLSRETTEALAAITA
jgi:hypothetical protein